MFKKILLPLDGSELAEAVIPYGEELFRKLGSNLVLFHSCGAAHRSARNMHRLYIEKAAEIVRGRLDKDTAQGNSRVTGEQVSGEFIPAVCSYIDEKQVDLIVMVAHGFTSPILDSVVDDVARLASCPTLLVRPKQVEGAGDLIQRILVPLDGTAYSQQILNIARPVAEALGAEVILFSAVKSAGLDPAAVEAEKKNAREYLQSVSRLLKGISVSVSVAEAADFAVAIDEAALQTRADMIAMVTNSPLTEWAESSLARKLLNKGATSLLVTHRK